MTQCVTGRGYHMFASRPRKPGNAEEIGGGELEELGELRGAWGS